jgi:hypothetical protein
MNASKGILIALGAVVIVAVAVFLIWFTDVDQTEETRLPSVTVEGGNLPEYNVESGSVTVEERTVEVPIPEVELRMNEEKVDVPSGISVNPPAPDGPEAAQ